ncbi:MAG: hypothetical protein JWP89_7075 [Schlesneria sp.]|nr:hypothetical protein [Schlesneria sp.]
MNLRSWPLCHFAVSVALFSTQALAGDSVQQPTLGKPELIGVLPVLDPEVKGINFEVKMASLDLYEEAELGQPILLASLIIEEVASPIPMAPADPQKIQEHLQQAAHLLSAAGLSEQSHVVRSVLDEFKSRHSDRLSLNRKRAELARLQAEIEHLSNVGVLLPARYTESRE